MAWYCHKHYATILDERPCKKCADGSPPLEAHPSLLELKRRIDLLAELLEEPERFKEQNVFDAIDEQINGLDRMLHTHYLVAPENHFGASTEKKPQKITLHRATSDDIPLYVAIEMSVGHLRTYSGITDPTEAAKEIAENIVYFIKTNDEVAGSIQYQIKSPDHAYLSGLVINPAFHGQGIGKAALLIILNELRETKRKHLATHPEKSTAIKL